MAICASRYFTDFRKNCAQNQKSPRAQPLSGSAESDGRAVSSVFFSSGAGGDSRDFPGSLPVLQVPGVQCT